VAGLAAQRRRRLDECIRARRLGGVLRVLAQPGFQLGQPPGQGRYQLGLLGLHPVPFGQQPVPFGQQPVPFGQQLQQLRNRWVGRHRGRRRYINHKDLPAGEVAVTDPVSLSITAGTSRRGAEGLNGYG
jgi:hypothetical protein